MHLFKFFYDSHYCFLDLPQIKMEFYLYFAAAILSYAEAEKIIIFQSGPYKIQRQQYDCYIFSSSYFVRIFSSEEKNSILK